MRLIYLILLLTLLQQVQSKLEAITMDDYEVASKLIVHYLTDQYATAVIHSDLLDTEFEEIVKNLQIPVYTHSRYFRPDELSYRKIKSLISQSKNHGTLIIGNHYNATFSTIHNVVVDHPNQKLAIAFTSSNQFEIERVLQELWTDHYQINVLVFDLRNHTTSLFNPFKRVFYHLESRGNSDQVIDEIGRILYERSKNFHKWPLNISIYDMDLVAESIKNSNGDIVEYDYIEGRYISYMVEYLNLTPNYMHLNYSGRYDSDYLEDYRRKIDSGDTMIAGNTWWVMDYGGSKTVYLYPNELVFMFYVVPVSYKTNHLNIFVLSMFETNTKWIVIALVLAYVGFWTSIEQLYQFHFGRRAYNVILKAAAILNSSSTKYPTDYRNRILFICLVLFFMVISNTYQGTILRQLNIKTEPRQLNTLEELLHSNLNISTTDYLVDLATQTTGVKCIDELNAKPGKVYKRMIEGVEVVAFEQTDALLLPDLFVGVYKAQIYDNITGRNLIKEITESVFSVLIAFAVDHSCPFIEELNVAQNSFVETGLSLHEMIRALYREELYYIKRIRNNEFDRGGSIHKQQPIVFEDMRILFQTWILLILAATLVLIMEIVHSWIYGP